MERARDYQRRIGMFSFEILAVAYFSALAVAAPLTRAEPAKTRRATGAALGLVALILVLAAWMPPAGRAWFGHLYLLSAYWLPALLVTRPSTRKLEAWLARTDELLWRHAIRFPRWTITVLDVSYMGCYVLVPIAFVVLWLGGEPAAVNRFWMAVLSAGLVCYGSLPWLVSDPPRLRASPPTTSANAVRRLNLFVLGRLSHGLNTFPSGHVAVSLAAALVVASISPAVGAVLLVIAAGIAAGAVAGRYHYLVDVLVGAIVGVFAGLIATAM